MMTGYESEIIRLLKENNLILKDCQRMLKELTDIETIQKRNEESFYRNVLANFEYDKLKKFFRL